MAKITRESLRAVANLADLDDAQCDAIIKQLGDRIGEIHGMYDNDLSKATGIDKKPGSGSSYNFWVEEITKLKGLADSVAQLKTDLEAKDKSIADFKAQIEKGGDEALITQLKADIEAGNTTIEAYKTKLADAEKKYNDKLGDIYKSNLDNSFIKATQDFTKKDGIGDRLWNLDLAAARASLEKEYKFEFVDTDAGSTLVISKDGIPVKESLSDLMKPLLKESLKEVRTQPGGGTNPPKDKPEVKDNVISLGTHKTQRSAMNELHERIMDLGHSVESKEYEVIKNATWDAVIAPLNLPLQ